MKEEEKVDMKGRWKESLFPGGGNR